MLKTIAESSVSESNVSPRMGSPKTGDWKQAHEALSRLARERAAADAEEGHWLLAALRAATHVHLGFGGFNEYIERLFGYKPRSTQEKLRVAVALEALPATAVAHETGALCWSAVRELTRVAVAETEQEWLAAARGKTVNQLEALVAGKPRGERPGAPVRPEAQRHVLRFEVAAETLCLFREAMNKLRRDSGASLDDDTALMSMARQVLQGPADVGRASYQIALTVCPQCNQGCQQTCGELVPVAAEVVAMAECDGQQLGVLPASVTEGSCSNERVTSEAHAGAPAEANAGNDAHTGAGKVAPDAHTGARARQSIPPATRRTVLRRDHHRCCVPGCRNTRFLDLHHIHLRSEGGGNQPSNIITLCGAHHRAIHRGELLISGSVPTVCFRHADGSDYGQVLDPSAVEIHARAFATLRNLDFRDGEIRRVLAVLCKNGGEQPSLENIVREAVARLTASK